MLVKLKAKMPSGDNDNPTQFSLVKGLSPGASYLTEPFHRFKKVSLILQKQESATFYSSYCYIVQSTLQKLCNIASSI